MHILRERRLAFTSGARSTAFRVANTATAELKRKGGQRPRERIRVSTVGGSLYWKVDCVPDDLLLYHAHTEVRLLPKLAFT